MQFLRILIIIPCLGYFTVCAQGLVMDDEFYESNPRQAIYGNGGKAELEVLDGIHKFSLKKYCPKIQHQGSASSCVGWATGYGALTIQKAIQNDWTNQNLITDQAFSSLFIFNQIKITDCNFGARIGDAVQLLKEKGDVLSKYYDANVEDCHKEITETDLDLASNHKIMDFMTLFGSNSHTKIKIYKTKLSLIQNRPVIIGMNLLNNFYKIPYRDSVWYPEIGDKGIFGGHAMVVVGFDDGLEAFEIMNSWGASWANYGFAWIKYEDFADYCSYGYQMILSNDSLETIHSSRFKVKKKVITLSDGTVLFRDENPVFNGEFYEYKETFKKESVFQLLGSDFNEGIYLYVFSIDPDKELKVHWPRDEQLDEKYNGLHESALITVYNSEILIPSELDAFLFDKAGNDYICFLYSTHPLDHINEQLKKIVQLQDHPLQSLYKVFGDELMKLNNVNYITNTIGFRNQIPSGKIVPLIVEFQIAEK